MIDLIKNKNLINLINIKKQFINSINTSFCFFELGCNLLEIYKTFKKISNSGDDIFDTELNTIEKNFENHKKKILLLNNDKDDSKLIQSIILNIKQDQKDIIELIENIEIRKEEKKEKSHNFKKFLKNTISTVAAFSAGAYFTGGYLQ